ncbi:hypothetical protein [Halosegnis sp.]
MSACPDCGDETTHRLAIIDPDELKAEREYCLTCEKFLDDDVRRPVDDGA